ncbi:MAG: hypothetical protein U5K69_06735 [Balneolaceae bacterium]|nr:hypothetical protein [Balneolaceae bacterium]
MTGARRARGMCPGRKTFSTLEEIGYEGWLTIEAFTRDDPDFANSINVWRAYNDPWEVAEDGYAFIRQMIQQHGS